MLKYLRNKMVSVDLDPPDRLCVHGILDDDLYGIEMDVVFGLDELEIRSIAGKWHRYTTPACPLALDHLEEVIGIRVGPGFRAGLQKGLGRTGCRHFAGLLIEMGHAARAAALVAGYQKALGADPELTLEAFEKQTGPKRVAATEAIGAAPIPPATEPAGIKESRVAPKPLVRASGGMVIDLHVHTAPASPCSSISVEALIAEARQIGLDGLVLTDHNHFRPPGEIENLRQKHGFLVLAGNEIITDQGDVLVYGLERDIQGVIPLEELRAEVQKAGGFMAMAHPFRGFLIFGAEQLGLTVEKASGRNMFDHVDAVEVLNGKVTADENDFARRVAARLGLAGLAGSDAHEAGSVGTYATEFSAGVKNESDLVRALHAGDFRPVAFRNN